MLFNSYIFILFLFPVTILGYFFLNRLERYAWAEWFLIAVSFWFYAYFDIKYTAILAGSILFNYVVSRRIHKGDSIAKFLTAVGVLANVGIIFLYKYYDFFVENINRFLRTDVRLLHLLMPLGISFFTFQQISYLVDSYRGETQEYSFAEYTLFVSFFPQLIAGPIVMHTEMIPQFRDSSRKKISDAYMHRGITLFVTGLAKKVLLADTLARGADWGFEHIGELNAVSALIVALLYTLQLYFDFSGYCDMASGIAACLHFDLPMNFDSPYKAVSIQDFWKRWHMSLNRFLTKYVYIPLGGNRKGNIRTIINILLVFLVSGIWHGAAWTFIVWGLLHGVASVLYHCTKKAYDILPKLVRWAITFVFVNFAWIFFRASDLRSAALFLHRFLDFSSVQLPGGLCGSFDSVTEFSYLTGHIGILKRLCDRIPLFLLIVLMLALFIALVPENSQRKKSNPNVMTAICIVVLFMWSLVSLSGVSTFLYFNF